MTSVPQLPNRAEAKRHLHLLDPGAEYFTFATFDDVILPDGKSRGDPRLLGTYHGRLDDHWNTLVRANLAGAGVYVTVNRTDLQGREGKNMTGSRATWGDFDRDPTATPPLVPSIVVSTSIGKGHCYWLCDALAPDEHLAAQERIIADYGADPNVKDFTRLLRLAGFYHRKREPFLVTVDERSTGKRYSREEILQAFPPIVRQKKAEPIPEVIPEGKRDSTLISVAGTMRKRGMSQDAIVAALHVENQTRCSPPLPDKQVDKIARSAGKYQPGSLTDSDTAVIDRLALMSQFDYERVRLEEAKTLGIKRVRVLDARVAARRAEIEAEASDDPMKPVEPWPEPVDGQDLIIGLCTVFHRYAVLPEHGGFVLSLWSIHAHAHDAWSISPYLALQSPEKQCGKSTVLDLLSQVVPKPRLSSSMTPAVMFRVIDQHKPTLLVDEADSLQKIDPEKLAIINSMHRRSSAYAERCTGDDHKATRFSTWAPLALAGIGELPDTAQDRSIVIWLRRMLPDEKIERLRLDKPAAFDALKRKAARWAADHFDELRNADPQMPAALGGRDADKWRPLIAIADAIGPLWGEMARTAAVQLSASVQAKATQRDYNRLLQDCRRVASTATAATIAPKDLLLALLSLNDADWSTRNRGRPVTPDYLAGALKHYGIVSDRTGKARFYRWADFADPWQRYLPPGSEEAESPATSAAQDAALAADFGDIRA